MKFNVTIDDDERTTYEVEALDAETAAELAAERAFDDWAWESFNSAYPMRMVIEGEHYTVEAEAVPQFSARRDRAG